MVSTAVGSITVSPIQPPKQLTQATTVLVKEASISLTSVAATETQKADSNESPCSAPTLSKSLKPPSRASAIKAKSNLMEDSGSESDESVWDNEPEEESVSAEEEIAEMDTSDTESEADQNDLSGELELDLAELMDNALIQQVEDYKATLIAPKLEEGTLTAPSESWTTLKNVECNEISSFVNYFGSVHGIKFKTFDSPNEIYVVETLKAWGMYDPKTMGLDWKASMNIWLNPIYKKSIMGYLSAFYELLTAEKMEHSLGKTYSKNKLFKLLFTFVNEPIFDLDPEVWSNVGFSIMGEKNPFEMMDSEEDE